MPTTKQLRVVVGAKGVAGIMVGDVITIRGRSGSVNSQRVLMKNMELELNDDNGSHFTRRLPMDSEVNVLRTEQTDDEKLADELERFAKRVVETAAVVTRHLNGSVIKLIESWETNKAKDHLYPFDLNGAVAIARLQYSQALWAQVADLANRSNEGGSDHRKILAAVMAVRAQCESELTARYRNSLSRSSSVVSNLETDMKLDAAAEFLKDTDWDAERLWEKVS